jgi:sigma-E factor negative regulatory protein RseA
MKQQISVLMDGELFDDEAEALLDKLKRSPDEHEEWQTYHLIGDVLRQPDHAYPNISAAMRERLQAEPTVLAPGRRTSRNARWFALSAAASVLALTLVAWMSVQVGSEPPPQMAMQQSTALRPASFSGNKGLNNYLMAHQEYSPSADVQGAASYIRTVADQ